MAEITLSGSSAVFDSETNELIVTWWTGIPQGHPDPMAFVSQPCARVVLPAEPLLEPAPEETVPEDTEPVLF